MTAEVNIGITIRKAPTGYDSDRGDQDSITDLLACLSKFAYVDLSIWPVDESAPLHHDKTEEKL